MSVILNKVDSKNVCGKAVTNFGRFLGADEYIVVNDDLKNDQEKMSLMELSVPGGVDFDCVSCKTYAKIAADNDYYGKKTIVVFAYLADLVKCVDLGLQLKSVNLSGVNDTGKENPTKLFSDLVLDAKDIDALKYLDSKGIELYYQKTVQEEKQDVKKLLNL